ncbi:MAG TPA: glycosyltransferase family 4 protein [Dehalococcoidia bacterium]|nr:glycosyltransferase family 4 protein [Dehalococcoidia bacterium]
MKVLVLTNMYPTPDMPILGSFVRDQVEALRKEGIDIDVFFVNGRKNKLNYVWGIFRLCVWLLTHRYDIIHAHYVFSGIIARTQFLHPVVLTHHGHEVFATWERFPSRMITPLVDKVILVSEEQKQKLGYEKAVVIPCGIDFDVFRPMPQAEARAKVNLPPEKKLVLWVGEFSRPEKRFDIVQAAVEIAREKDPSIELVLVWDKPHDLIPVYMNACDALFLVSDGEGSPMVIKEAMACNTPVVSVPVGDVADVIGGTDGCYLCSQDPNDVAEKLILAINHPGRTNGREMISHMEQSNIAKRIVAVYEELLQEKNGRRRHC